VYPRKGNELKDKAMQLLEFLPSDFPTMSLKEEFECCLEDALEPYYQADVTEFMTAFAEEMYGIAWCDETEEEVMEYICDDPFVMNDFADQFYAEI
jgi:hypothetical protein